MQALFSAFRKSVRVMAADFPLILILGRSHNNFGNSFKNLISARLWPGRYQKFPLNLKGQKWRRAA
jgi:hypothetical protein